MRCMLRLGIFISFIIERYLFLFLQINVLLISHLHKSLKQQVQYISISTLYLSQDKQIFLKKLSEQDKLKIIFCLSSERNQSLAMVISVFLRKKFLGNGLNNSIIVSFVFVFTIPVQSSQLLCYCFGQKYVNHLYNYRMSTNLLSAGIFSQKSRSYPEIEPLFCWQSTVEAHHHALLMFSFN